MTRLDEKYKGFGLRVDDDGWFIAHEIETQGPSGIVAYGEQVARAETLAGLKKMVDAISRAKLQRPCLIEAGDDSFIEGTICSIKSTHYGFVYRVTYKKAKLNHREELRAKDIYKDTTKNRETFSRIALLKKQIASQEAVQEKLQNSLESFSDTELMDTSSSREEEVAQ